MNTNDAVKALVFDHARRDATTEDLSRALLALSQANNGQPSYGDRYSIAVAYETFRSGYHARMEWIRPSPSAPKR